MKLPATNKRWMVIYGLLVRPTDLLRGLIEVLITEDFTENYTTSKRVLRGQNKVKCTHTHLPDQ